MTETEKTEASVTQMGRVVIAGGTGFLGQNLARHLTNLGCDVVVMSRYATDFNGRWLHAVWDARTIGDWVHHLEGATALVNLAGRTVDCIKTPDHCDEILRSRVESTEVLGHALKSVKTLPRVWVQMSTAHIYGDPPEDVCDEDSSFGWGLAPFVAREWEKTFARGAPSTMRQVILRTSFVLGKHGGALRQLSRVVRWGLGGTVGHGRQGISWIHEQDMDRLFERAIFDDSMRGTYIATAPNPVSNAEFMREMRSAHHVPIGLPAASWMVRLAAGLVLRSDSDLALYGRYCVSRRLREEGFEFRFPDVRSALQNLYNP
jgi:uncharacterized protein (TIGR01777 family)